MINIWGQPLSASEKKPAADSIKDVKKIIEDEIAETLNLASVDPEEIVVFQDRTGKLKTSNVSLDDILTRQRDAADDSIALFQDGKLKTSNVSLDDILTRQRDAADDSIALFQDGKLKPGALMSDILTRRHDAADDSIALFQDGKLKPGALVNTITDKLTEYDKEFNEHIKNYNNFRKNVVHKFFGSPISVLPSLADIKTSIEQQEIAADIIRNDLSKVFPQLEKNNADLQKMSMMEK